MQSLRCFQPIFWSHFSPCPRKFYGQRWGSGLLATPPAKRWPMCSASCSPARLSPSLAWATTDTGQSAASRLSSHLPGTCCTVAKWWWSRGRSPFWWHFHKCSFSCRWKQKNTINSSHTLTYVPIITWIHIPVVNTHLHGCGQSWFQFFNF